MNRESVVQGLKKISAKMDENKAYLIQLDQQNGDGDLGISMSEGFKAAADYAASTDEKDLGKLLMKVGRAFNEAAPSSLGTILSFGFMGMAKALKGKEESTVEMFTEALSAGIQKIMDKAGSKTGEKTILDALCPAVKAMEQATDFGEGLKLAAKAAAEGSESTKEMRSVHGRAAYYGDQSIGLIDGGSVVGRLIFEALSE